MLLKKEHQQQPKTAIDALSRFLKKIVFLKSKDAATKLHLKQESNSTHHIFYKNGAITNATTDINLSKMFKDGPDVSLNGSPTVSPTTVALCGSEPL